MKFLGAFAFLALMFVKVSALHVYTHQEFEDETIEECTFCDLAIENQNAELLATTATEIPFRQLFFLDRSPSIKKQDNPSKAEENLHLFLRPPPRA